MKLIRHDITLAGLDPTGEVSRAALVVSGCMKEISWLPPPSRESGVVSISSDTRYRIPGFEWGKCLFDYHDNEIPEVLWLLIVALEVKSLNCLVLARVGIEEQYRRVGFARLRRVSDMSTLSELFQLSNITII